MIAIVLTVVAFVGGAAVVYFVIEHKRTEVRDGLQRLKSERRDLFEREREVAEVGAKQKAATLGLASARQSLVRERAALDAKLIPYQTLVAENARLKTHLAHADLIARKAEADAAGAGDGQSRSESRLAELGRLYLRIVCDTALKALKPGNYTAQRGTVEKAIAKARLLGVAVADVQETAMIEEIKSKFEAVVRAEAAQEEQARVKALAREEARREREAQEEVDRAAREQEKIEQALARALAEAKAAADGTQARHAAEVARLQGATCRRGRQVAAGEVAGATHQNGARLRHLKPRLVRRWHPQDRHDAAAQATRPRGRTRGRFSTVPVRCPHDDSL